MFEGVSFKIENDCFIVISGLTGKVLLQQNLKFSNNQELDVFVKELEKKAWFDTDAKNLVINASNSAMNGI